MTFVSKPTKSGTRNRQSLVPALPRRRLFPAAVEPRSGGGLPRFLTGCGQSPSRADAARSAAGEGCGEGPPSPRKTAERIAPAIRAAIRWGKRPASARTTGFPISSRTDSHAGRFIHRLLTGRTPGGRRSVVVALPQMGDQIPDRDEFERNPGSQQQLRRGIETRAAPVGLVALEGLAALERNAADILGIAGLHPAARHEAPERRADERRRAADRKRDRAPLPVVGPDPSGRDLARVLRPPGPARRRDPGAFQQGRREGRRPGKERGGEEAEDDGGGGRSHPGVPFRARPDRVPAPGRIPGHPERHRAGPESPWGGAGSRSPGHDGR